MGSYGSDRERPDSDFDLAVSVGGPLTYEERVHLMESLADITHRPVDLIDLETAHGLILKQALRNGKPLIPSCPGTFERLLKRLVYEQEDLAPQIALAKSNRVKAFAHGF